MSELKIIDKRTVLEKDFQMYGTFEEPLFLARDVADWIEYNPDDINKFVNMVDDSEKLTRTIFRSGQNREMWFLTENGLYEVLMQSRKPIAKQFKAKVKQILKDLRTGKTKIVGMTEYQQMMAQTRAENAKIRKARELFRLADKYKGQTFAQVLDSHATYELTGERLVPLPEIKAKTYSATEIGRELGVSSNMIGILANRHGLKVDRYGAWYNDKAKGHGKEVPSFRYFENVIPVLQGILQSQGEGA